MNFNSVAWPSGRAFSEDMLHAHGIFRFRVNLISWHKVLRMSPNSNSSCMYWSTSKTGQSSPYPFAKGISQGGNRMPFEYRGSEDERE